MMRAGLPVITTDVGGSSEAVTDGVNGYLVGIGDIEGMRKRLVSLLEDGELAGARMGYFLLPVRGSNRISRLERRRPPRLPRSIGRLLAGRNANFRSKPVFRSEHHEESKRNSRREISAAPRARDEACTHGLVAAGAALLSLAFGVMAASPSLTPPPPAAGYRLVFNDEFDSLDLSPDASGNHTWYANVWFNHKPRPIQNISVSDGILHLKWTRGQKSDDTSIESASPDGRYFHAWRYAYFEARMKWDVDLQVGRGRLSGSCPSKVPALKTAMRDSRRGANLTFSKVRGIGRQRSSEPFTIG